MKIIAIIAALIATALILMAVVPTAPTPITLSWQYATNAVSDDLAFNVYRSDHIDEPMTNWPLLKTYLFTNINTTNIVGSNYQFNVTFTMTPAQCFYFTTASNFWGESFPSNTNSTPPIPKPTTTLKIER